MHEPNKDKNLKKPYHESTDQNKTNRPHQPNAPPISLLTQSQNYGSAYSDLMNLLSAQHALGHLNPTNINPSNIPINPSNINPSNINPSNINPSNINPSNINISNIRHEMNIDVNNETEKRDIYEGQEQTPQTQQEATDFYKGLIPINPVRSRIEESTMSSYTTNTPNLSRSTGIDLNPTALNTVGNSPSYSLANIAGFQNLFPFFSGLSNISGTQQFDQNTRVAQNIQYLNFLQTLNSQIQSSNASSLLSQTHPNEIPNPPVLGNLNTTLESGPTIVTRSSPPSEEEEEEEDDDDGTTITPEEEENKRSRPITLAMLQKANKKGWTQRQTADIYDVSLSTIKRNIKRHDYNWVRVKRARPFSNVDDNPASHKKKK